MRRFARSYLVFPLAALLLVVVPAVLISLAASYPSVEGKTIPPPTHTPRPRPTRTPVSTATHTPANTPTSSPTSTVTPTATPTGTPDPRIKANGYLLERVIGNRLSPTLYGLTQNGRLYRSPNDGGTWQLMASEAAVDDFLFGPEDSGVLYTGRLECLGPEPRPHLLRSEDGGSGWTILELDKALLPLLVDPGDSMALLASGCDGVYASSDGGKSWEQRSTTGHNGIPEGFVIRLLVPVYYANTAESMEQSIDVLYGAAYDEAGAAVVLLSEDGGATWSIITPLMDGVEFHITALTADIMTQGHAWFSADKGVWGTTDDGQSWSFSSRGLDGDAVLHSLVYHPSDRLYLGTALGLYARPADGLQWSLVGERSLPSQEILSILFTDSRPGVLWLNTANGVFKYTPPR